MKIQSLSLLFAAIFLLNACGGAATDTSSQSATASSTTTLPSDPISSVASSKSSSSQASTSSSSLSSSSACSKVEGDIFIDCTDLAWKGVQAFEQTKDNKTQGSVTDGTQGQIAIWHTLVSADQGHNNVIEVQFKDNDNYNALIHFIANTPNETRDMSAYATGKLTFDIKLLNAGKFTPQLNVMLECVYPCISHDRHLSIPALNQWTSIEIPIAEFIEGGMDLTKTSIGFEIVPEWNKQNGVQFQIDNIRWIKGVGVAPIPEAHCYEQRFETWGLAYQLDTLIGSTSLTSTALTKIISTSEMTPNWSATTDKLGYAPKTDNTFTPCAFTDGRLSAQVYLPKSYVDDGQMRIGLYYQDSSARRAYFAPVSAATFAADSWKTISSSLVTTNNAPAFSTADAAFDINNINYVGVYFDANGKPANVGGMLRVDNIFISGKPIIPNIPNPNSSSSSSSQSSSSSSVSTSSSSSSSSSSLVSSASSSAPTSSSSSSKANCSVSAKVAAISPKLGFGISSGNSAYLTITLNNADYAAPSPPDVSLANATVLFVYSIDSRRVYQVSANTSIPQTSEFNISLGYQQLDSSANVTVETGLYSSPAEAVNGSTMGSLHSTNTLITGPANCGP